MVRKSVAAQVNANNAEVMTDLVRQLRSPAGVIPFLGAGVSAPFYPQWAPFLSDVAAEKLDARGRALVAAAMKDNDYLRAADLLGQQLGAPEFQQLLADRFHDELVKPADLGRGACGYLPLISSGPVITTNFDHLAERVFAAAGRRFDTHVYGANPNEVVPALQQNKNVLWKIHGDVGDPRTRVFGKSEYKKHYKNLPGILAVAFLNRPALFIGCSLETDRTVPVLKALHEEHPETSHFAILQIAETDEEFERRVKELRAMGVRPIWYEKGKYEQIETLLYQIVRDASSFLLSRARPPATPPPPKSSSLFGMIGFAAEQFQLASAETPGADDHSDIPPYVAILDGILRGRVAFFLGAGACLGRLPLSQAFYDELIHHLGLPTGWTMEAPRLAQHFADKEGRDALESEVKRQLAAQQPSPTIVHRFIAILRQRMRQTKLSPFQQWIITTNYDNWMAAALNSAGEPFHLFTYRVSGEQAGKFVHQAPDGEVRVIDRPANFRRLPAEGTFLVHLHGGLHETIDLETSYAFVHRDFIELAGKIPDALPNVVFERIAERSLLFLGSGLRDDSVESLVRAIQARDAKRVSHAIMHDPDGARIAPEKVLYWKELGVEIYDTALGEFILKLNGELERRIRTPS